MKLSEGIKLKGKGVGIPDCSRDDLPQFFVEMGYKVGAEIGVYKGEYTEILLKAGLKIYGIDPWTAYSDYDDPDHNRFQEGLDYLYGHTQRRLAPYLQNGQCTLVRKTSMEAINDFEGESLDFVYVDGNHHFKYVAEDICEWIKKIKKGGIISGHDYASEGVSDRDPHVIHVKYVVDAYTEAYEIENWYILGREEKLEGEKRERFRSWMWIKP